MQGSHGGGVDTTALKRVAKALYELQKQGNEIAVVLGGGNLFRGLSGAESLELERCAADQVGMLATMMNALLLEQALSKLSVQATIMSALDCPQIVERFHWEKARKRLSNQEMLIFAGGTGHPYFTTDTAAALRASEIRADFFWKATTRVEGVYDKDPLKHKDACFLKQLSYEDFLQKKLGIMDLTAVTLCMTNQIPIRVFKFDGDSLLDGSSGSEIR